MSFVTYVLLLLFLCLGPASASAHARVPAGTTAKLTLLETTDLHAHVLGYDYYKLRATPHVGLARTATLIDRARKHYPNTLLFDAGDTIQGTVAADYQAKVEPLPCDKELAVYRAMDVLDYDAGTLGNHEFNYGLDFLSQVTGTPMRAKGVEVKRCAGPDYPLVLSNVFSLETGKPLYQPWLMLDRTITATTPDGQTIKAPIRIAVMGFAPPPIMHWDKRHLEGRVRVMGVVEAAKKYMPAIKARHPDLVIAIIHGGISTAPYTPQMENAAWYLAQVAGIDAMLMGHMHAAFPGPRFADMKGVDDVSGRVNGVPAVMGGFFGKDLGLIHLALTYRRGQWVSDAAAARSEVKPICADKDACVPPDPRIAPLVEDLHQATIAYVNTPIDHADFRMSTYFSALGNMTALSVVNAAQRDYVKQWIADNRPDLADVPVLSAAAAFRTGYGGPSDYTNVAPGAVTIRSVADLYYYPNMLAAVDVDGATLKAWLEHSARRFNRIDPAQAAPQPLINAHVPGFNFDQIQGPGLQYVIDVSQPVGQRVVRLTWKGRPVAPDQRFIVATNNYRAGGGGHFPGMDGTHTVLNAPDGNRAILMAWLRRHPHLGRGDVPPRSWHFAPLQTRGAVTVVAPSGKAELAQRLGLHVRTLESHADGTSTYAVAFPAIDP
ncbi:MAG TPA: bifunctional 2',3'-cyclic-nucleotide 2'-phosphodiesterase/3'-nucleotidase [Oleiagrimonas sp.]|nr:bifunctional 2',3'-cyclic-nucleotide 2'-phosphodiesterase/3'-nucleotidase [Oleiagrimonas sp.]